MPVWSGHSRELDLTCDMHGAIVFQDERARHAFWDQGDLSRELAINRIRDALRKAGVSKEASSSEGV